MVYKNQTAIDSWYSLYILVAFCLCDLAMTPYSIQYDNLNEDILTRLLKIRNVDCAVEDFLDPSIGLYWTNPFLLNDMEKSVTRIISALKNKEHITIFADYDVDGVTSSFLLHTFFVRFLKYDNVSIHYPDRLTE